MQLSMLQHLHDAEAMFQSHETGLRKVSDALLVAFAAGIKPVAAQMHQEPDHASSGPAMVKPGHLGKRRVART